MHFIREKAAYWKKYEPIGRRPAPPHPFESAAGPLCTTKMGNEYISKHMLMNQQTR